MGVFHYQWKATMKSKRTAALLAVAVLGTAGQQATTRPETRPICEGVDVRPGQNLTRIAAGMDVALSDLIAANPQIVNPNLIWPGQRICSPPAQVIPVQIIEPLIVERPVPAEMQLAPPVVEPEWPTTGVASREQILHALWKMGARGEQLVDLGAITECESGRWLGAVGDETITDHEYGPSVTPWQVRTMHSQRGTGRARDIDALTADPLGHGAAAAIEIYDAAGRNPLSPWWNCHLKLKTNQDRQTYTELATQLGMLP